MPAVRIRILAPWLPVSLALLACQAEPSHDSHAAPNSEPGLAPRVETEPEPTPEPEPEPTPAEPEPTPAEPEPTPELDADPVLAERKQALADVGRSAFEALQSGSFSDLLDLTPLEPGPLKDACKRMPLSKRPELEARFEHCHATIPWGKVTEAQAFAGKPTGRPADGCDAGYEDYGRIQLFVHTEAGTIWRVEFFGAVGQDGKVVGINGEVTCKQVDSAPELDG
jgi:hypothetical protein